MTRDEEESPAVSPLKDRAGPALVKRFYQHVACEPASHKGAGGEGWHVLLDGRPIKSPAGHALVLPGEELAQRLVAEWDGQKDHILLETMPFTQLAQFCSVQDVQKMEEARAEIISHALNDLILYRADHPQVLQKRQEALWDPVLAWLGKEFDLAFRTTKGILHVQQPESTDEKLAAVLAVFEEGTEPQPQAKRQALLALLKMTKISGSALLSLACIYGFCTLHDAWKWACLDEDYQMEVWGKDPEACAIQQQKQAAFETAALYFKLCLPDFPGG